MTHTVEDALKLVKLALVSIADEADAAKSQQLAKEVLAVVEGVTVQDAVAWHDKIIGMEVSMDVSTGDHDIDHRVYGQVYEVMLAYDGSPDVILAIESERNFGTTNAQPVQVQEATKVTTKFTVPKQWQVELADELYGDVRLVAPCGEAWRFRNTDGSDEFVWKFLISILAEKGQV
jgi:hypothetical protein